MLNLMVLVANSGFIVPIYAFFALAMYCIVVFQAVATGKISFWGVSRKEFWLLLIFGLCFSCSLRDSAEYSFAASLVLNWINPVLLYEAGYIISKSSANDQNKRIRYVIFSMAVGCGVHVIFNIIGNMGKARWELVDVIPSKRRMAATNLGSISTIIFCLVPFFILTKDSKIKFIGAMLVVASMCFLMMSGTRTQLIILIIVMLVFIITYIIKHYKKRIPVNQLRKSLFGLIICLLVISVVLLSIPGIRDRILGSNLSYRYVDPDTRGSDLYRLSLLSEGLSGLLKYPFGGNPTVHLFHNYWLDIGRVTGIIPLLFILSFDILVFRHMLRLLKRKEIDEDIKYMFLGLYIGILLNFSVEPIMDGYTQLFYQFCFINGITEGMYRHAANQPMRSAKCGRSLKRNSGKAISVV